MNESKSFVLNFTLTGTEAHRFNPLHVERTRAEGRPVVDRGLFKGVLGTVKFLARELAVELQDIELRDRETAIYDETTMTVSFDVKAECMALINKSHLRSLLKECTKTRYILSVKLKY